MKTITKALYLVACSTLAFVPAAQAQVVSPATEKAFVNVNFGVQLADRTIGTAMTKTVYDEPASLSSNQPVSGGAIFDISAGYRVWGDVYAAIDITTFGDTEVANTTTVIPDPLFFNRARTTEGTINDLKRSEVAVSPNVIWATTLTDKLDLAVGLGIAIIKVKQELAHDFTVAAGTQNATVLTREESGTATGIYANVDFIYNLKPRYGVGAFVRYAGGKVDLDSVQDHNVGGMQAGGGIRLRF